MQINATYLVDLLIAASENYPYRTAVKDVNAELTYAELYDRSLKVAGFLTKYGVKPGETVICVCEKNVESMLCFWGIQLAGGVVALIEPEENTNGWVRKMESLKPKAIIFNKVKNGTIAGFDARMQFDFSEPLSEESKLQKRGVFSLTGDSICYILLTSGTLGTPKAVPISHANILHYTRSVYEYIGCPNGLNAAHVTTFAADLGLTNLLMALISGGMLRICNKGESTDPDLFSTIITTDVITFLKTTPSHFTALTSNTLVFANPISYVVLGGEKLNWKTAKFFLDSGLCKALYNHYGPTETTVGVSMFHVQMSYPHYNMTGSVPIGKPLGDGVCFLTDDLPDHSGVLCVAGPGVSSGYLNNKKENEERFAVRELNGKSTRYYITGDVCKQLPDGNFEFLYRKDRQVKVRGYRVELGEIELLLDTHPDVEKAIVGSRDTEGRPILEAFIKPVQGKLLNQRQIRAWLSETLPDYKIPSIINFFTDSPYNTNGKTDIQQIKDKFNSPGGEMNPKEVEKTGGNDWREIVTNYWKSLLNLSDVSDDDNFFETGGDSLLAIQLIGKLQRDGYKINTTGLIDNPVLRAFTALSPEKIKQEPYNVTPDQNRLTASQEAFLRQRDFEHDFYCQAVLFETNGKVSSQEMARALYFLVRNHPQLNRVFDTQGDAEPSAGVSLEVHIIDGKMPSIAQIQSIVRNQMKTISLNTGKLFVGLHFIDSRGTNYIAFIAHHLCVDVISWNILLDEFLEYYSQLTLGITPEIKVENALNNFYAALASNTEEHALPPSVYYRLPVTDKKPENSDSSGTFVCRLPEHLCAFMLRQDPAESRASISGILLNALGTALLNYFDLPALTIDTEFHGRSQKKELPDLSRSVAWWATTLPVNIERNHLSPHYCDNLLKSKSLHGNELNAFYSVRDRLLKKADVRFNYLGHFPEQYGNTAISLTPSCLHPGITRSKGALNEYKLYFTARLIGKELVMDFQYSLEAFEVNSLPIILKTITETLLHSSPNEVPGSKLPQVRWQECSLPTVGLPLFKLDPQICYKNESGPRTVFLTGATGFLGVHLLMKMLREEDVIVYCLVRGTNQEEAEYRLNDSLSHYFGALFRSLKNKVKVLNGDLRQVDFGLSAAMYEELSAAVDVIIHGASDVNLLKRYDELSETNVNPVINIIRLAKKNKPKELHYVSTLAVAGRVDGQGQSLFSEDEFERGQAFISGYEHSKYEAEKLVRGFLSQEGKGKIYRSGHIAGDSVYSQFQRNSENNRIFQLIQGFILLKKFPAEFSESVSFSYVDVIANGIVHYALGHLKNDSSCVHLDNPHYMPFRSVIALLQSMDYDIEIVTKDVFMKSVADYTGGVRETELVNLMGIWVQRYFESPRHTTFVSSRSIDTLAASGIYFPKTELGWFKNFIKGGVRASKIIGATTLENNIKRPVSGVR